MSPTNDTKLRPQRTGRTVIGRLVIIRHSGVLYTATVIDSVAGENRAKRVRIQTKGTKQGTVLMPRDYDLIEFKP